MRFVLAMVFGAVLAGLAPAPASAFCFPPCLPPCGIVYEPVPVTCFRAEWHEQRVPCVVHRVTYRREVTQVNTHVWVPKLHETNVRQTFYTPVPREVERDVPVCVTTAAWVIDPWTCCPYVAYYPQWTMQRVRAITYDFRRDERDVPVRVWRWEKQDRLVDQVRWIPEVTPEQSWTVQRTCVMVPYQSIVWTPCWR